MISKIATILFLLYSTKSVQLLIPFECPTANGFYPNYNNFSTFYQCINYQWIWHRCPSVLSPFSPLVWNQEARKCSHHRCNNITWTEQDSSHSMTWTWNCSSGIPLLQNCAPGTHWVSNPLPGYCKLSVQALFVGQTDTTMISHGTVFTSVTYTTVFMSSTSTTTMKNYTTAINTTVNVPIKTRRALIFGLGIGLTLLILLSVGLGTLFFVWYRHRQRKGTTQQTENKTQMTRDSVVSKETPDSINIPSAPSFEKLPEPPSPPPPTFDSLPSQPLVLSPTSNPPLYKTVPKWKKSINLRQTFTEE